MNKRIAKTFLAILLIAYACAGSDSQDKDEAKAGAQQDKPVIYVVNYPLQYFAERIGGDAVDVHFPAPADVDPAFWNPDAGTVVSYQGADVILLNGATYTKWTSKVSLPTSKTVDTSEPFKDRYIEVTSAVTHSHGPGGEHAHTGTAFTTWLDLAQAAQQAAAIRDALTARWPDRREQWTSGFDELDEELRALDTDLQNAVAGKQSLALIASHPVYQYLARRYALNITSVMWEPDEFPSERQWRELAQLSETHDAGWMVWEGEPLEASLARLEEMGVRSVVFAPCGNVPPEGDFMSVMRGNVDRLKAVYLQ
jgi:zinc transport system substrate-binding protein